MTRIAPGFVILAFLPWTSFGQFARTGFPTQEDYCRDNPKAAMCPNGRPISADNPLVFYTPPTPAPFNMPAAGASRQRTASVVAAPRSAPATGVALQDWRFSHSAPAMLVSINIGSLLQSPIWGSLFSALGAEGAELKTAAMEKARSALGDIGQLLISVSPNGTQSPSVLVLARGNMDGAAGAWLRSSPGMQIKRLDAITTLVGDAHSIEFANLRMQGKAPRATFNALQQTATREALKYDAWIGLDPHNLASLTSSLGAGSNPALSMLGNLRGLSIGLYLRDQLRLEAVLETPSPEMAARMLAGYQQAEAQRKDPEAKIWAVAEGANLRFTQIVDASHLKEATAIDPAVSQMLAPQIASLMKALTGSNPQSASLATPKASPGVIVIQGLDGGPKQLPAK